MTRNDPRNVCGPRGSILQQFEAVLSMPDHISLYSYVRGDGCSAFPLAMQLSEYRVLPVSFFGDGWSVQYIGGRRLARGTIRCLNLKANRRYFFMWRNEMTSYVVLTQIPLLELEVRYYVQVLLSIV
jgi:hypothetical protein